MHKAGKRASLENIQPSSSLPTRRAQVGHLLIAALAGLGAGLAASLVTVVLMGVLRLAAGVPTPVELFGDHVLKLLPPGKFVDLLIQFSPHSNTTPLDFTLLGMIAAGTELVALYPDLVHTVLPASGDLPKEREWH